MSCKCGCGRPATWGVGLTDFAAGDDAEIVIEYFATQACLVRLGLYCLHHERVNVVGRLWLEIEDDPHSWRLVGCCPACAVEAARVMERLRREELLDRVQKAKSERVFTDTITRVAGLEDLHFTTPEIRILAGLLVYAALTHANPETLLAKIEQILRGHHNRLKKG